jgi:hypothetical protein
MKNLVLAAGVTLVAAVGCGGGGSGDAIITANWSLKQVNGTVIPTCPPGVDTAEVVAQEIGAGGTPVGAPIIDLYNCDDFSGTSTYPPADYDVFVALTGPSGDYAQSLTAAVDVTVQDKTVTVDIFDDGGYFSLAWTLKGASGAPLQCSQVPGIDGVEAISTDVANANNAVTDQFTCEDGAAVTAALLAGTYTVAVAAINAQDQALGPSTTLTNKAVPRQNGVTNLGTVEVSIDGL